MADAEVPEKKKKSGHQNLKAKAEREEKERRNELKRRKAGAEVKEHVKPFLRAGEPPIGNPVAGVAWANDVNMLLMDMVLKDPILPFEKKLRYLSDLIGKAGLLHSKAHVQKRLEEIVEKDEEAEEDDSNGLQPNPLARDGTKGRGGKAEEPESVRRSVPGPPSEDDGQDPP